MKAISSSAIIAIVALFCSGCKPDSDKFRQFTGYALPADAKNFRWETKNHDEFGDHDGIISFTASKESLRKIVEVPISGEAAWITANGTTYDVQLRQEKETRMLTGKVDLNAGTFLLKYSTW